MAEEDSNVDVSTSSSRRMFCMKRPEVFEVLGQMASGYVCIEGSHWWHYCSMHSQWRLSPVSGHRFNGINTVPRTSHCVGSAVQSTCEAQKRKEQASLFSNVLFVA